MEDSWLFDLCVALLKQGIDGMDMDLVLAPTAKGLVWQEDPSIAFRRIKDFLGHALEDLEKKEQDLARKAEIQAFLKEHFYGEDFDLLYDRIRAVIKPEKKALEEPEIRYVANLGAKLFKGFSITVDDKIVAQYRFCECCGKQVEILHVDCCPASK